MSWKRGHTPPLLRGLERPSGAPNLPCHLPLWLVLSANSAPATQAVAAPPMCQVHSCLRALHHLFLLSGAFFPLISSYFTLSLLRCFFKYPGTFPWAPSSPALPVLPPWLTSCRIYHQLRTITVTHSLCLLSVLPLPLPTPEQKLHVGREFSPVCSAEVPSA